MSDRNLIIHDEQTSLKLKAAALKMEREFAETTIPELLDDLERKYSFMRRINKNINYEFQAIVMLNMMDPVDQRDVERLIVPKYRDIILANSLN